MNMSDKNKGPFVVVSAFYPRNMDDVNSEVDLLRSPYSTYEIEGPKMGFHTKEDARKYAIRYRRQSCWFDGWEDLYGEEEDLDVDEWDSHDLENYDNDEELTISIMRLSHFNAEIARKTKLLEDFFDKKGAKERKQRNKKREKILRVGRVHYSFPPPPKGFDIPAEVELMICNDKFYSVPRVEQLKFKQNGTFEECTVSELASCKSIQMRFVENADVTKMKEQTELIFKSCKKLQELHWHEAKFIPDIIGKDCGPSARKRMKNLKVLSMPYTYPFTHEDLAQVRNSCTSLDRLELRGSYYVQDFTIVDLGCHGDDASDDK